MAGKEPGFAGPPAALPLQRSFSHQEVPFTPSLLYTPCLPTAHSAKGEGTHPVPRGVLLNPSGFPGAPRKGPGRRVGQAGKVEKTPTQSGPGVPSSTYLRHQSIFGVGSGSPRKIWGEPSLSPLSDGTLWERGFQGQANWKEGGEAPTRPSWMVAG